MTRSGDKQTAQLKKDLKRISDELDQDLEDRRKEWEQIPWHAQIGFVEVAQEASQVDKTERDLAVTRAKVAEQQNESYNKGPKARKEAGALHIQRIAQLIEEFRAKTPNAKEAQLRRKANRQYAQERRGAGERVNGDYFYKDDKHLRERLKKYSADQ